MSPRSRARQVVLQLLYQDDLNPEIDPTAVTKFLRKELDRNASLIDFALSLLDGVRQHRAELDQVLAGKAENWSLERMAVVDRNILRLGAYEILYTDTPGQVASTRPWNWPSCSARTVGPIRQRDPGPRDAPSEQGTAE